ncbi:MAG: Wadjet anti-phage system protein JetA family protein [Candidatus Marinarcus sp.]|uniref:Wadjet anti-phage system protein JetA family protein n=1 Tax=Candidatus Marinarcus sp. TaxID=3100987 RepID=UPI003B00275A
MYATSFNDSFFNALTGKNAELIERSLVALYDANYGNNTTFFDDMSRDDVKRTILSAIGGLDWHDEETNDKIQKDHIKANHIIAKLKLCGWIDFPTNQFKHTKFFSFTKYGKKFAQLIFSLQDNDIDLSKQRNVRQTKFSLEAYKTENDPQHLLDAFNTSKEVISDLTDAIHDIKELKNLLMQKARESIEDAGENFLDFLSNRFKNDIANRFGEDSVERYQHDIKEIVYEILSENNEERVKRVSSLNKGMYISFYSRHESLEKILHSINDRILNACEMKLPSLKKEVQSYISSGGKIFKQTSALLLNNNKKLYSFATKIKNADNETKFKLLNSFAQNISSPKLKIYDTNGVKIKNKAAKDKDVCVIGEESKISLDVLINSIYHKKKIEAFSYTQYEQEQYIESLFSHGNVLFSKEFPIEKSKDILLSLFSIDYITKNDELYEIKKTNTYDDHFYYKTEGFQITRKK